MAAITAIIISTANGFLLVPATNVIRYSVYLPRTRPLSVSADIRQLDQHKTFPGKMESLF